MKKYILYIGALALALPFVSCEKDKIELNTIDVNELERMPMTLFRDIKNTNKDETGTYGCHCITEERNTIYLSWNGIEGCAGYEIRYALKPSVASGYAEDWDSRYIEDIVINDPNQLELYIENLEYSTTYRFAIRTLSPKGEQYHSNWHGYGNLRQWDDWIGIDTEERYPTPVVLTCSNKDYNGFKVNFDLNYANSGDNKTNNYTENFEVGADGNYVAHTLVVKPSPTNPDAECPAKWSSYKLTEADRAAGYIMVDGLTPNSVYVVYLVNDNVKVPVDAMYNQIAYRTYGDPGAPITITHTLEAPNRNKDRYLDEYGSFKQETYDQDVLVHEASLAYNACRLDTILSRYNSDASLAEGQTFYLEGDKAYYFEGNFTICKGFNLETLPSDLAQGKRAQVYLGGIRKEGTSVISNNFMLGRTKEPGEADAPISVDNIIFKGIDFDCPLAQNYGQGSSTGNYFANMYSGGMAVTFESFQLIDCTFQRMIRGFIRVQGTKTKFFNHILIDGCLFYNCGYYDNNGRGYAWFAGDGASAKSNIYKDVTFRNSTIYDCPRTCMFTDNGKDLAWGSDINYHVTLENCTVINYSTRTSGRYIFDFKFIPGGSTITVRNNLFVLAADDNDARNLNFQGMSIQNVRGSGLIAFDIKDNYSVGCRDKHYADDGIFTGQTFSAKKNSAGTHISLGDNNPGWGVLNGADELKVKVGSTPLKATDLFNSPNAPYSAHNPTSAKPEDHAAPANIFEALKYKMTSGHEIIDKHVGDQRWLSADPRMYYKDLQPGNFSR